MSYALQPHGVAHQAPLFMGFPRQEYWSGLLFLSPGDHLNPGIKPKSPAWQVDSLSESFGNNFNFNPLSGKWWHAKLPAYPYSVYAHLKFSSNIMEPDFQLITYTKLNIEFSHPLPNLSTISLLHPLWGSPRCHVLS